MRPADGAGWARLDAELDTAADRVSIQVGPLAGAPVHTRSPAATHYAASTMKVAVLAALHRAAAEGAVDLDEPVPVRNRFRSAQPGAGLFGCARQGDGDPAVWARIGGAATPRWLAHRMITRSSNLATNLVLARVGLAAVARVWDLAGARHSVTARGIEDYAARDAGLENLVTAADLAALLATIAAGALDGGSPITDRDRCAEMIGVLLAQRRREDLAAGLPPHARVAHKNGWIRGIRHAAGVVFPDDAAPYAVAVCVSADPAARPADPAAGAAWDAAARALIARVSATAWSARRTGGAG